MDKNKKRKLEIVNFWTNVDQNYAKGAYPDHLIIGHYSGNHDLYELRHKDRLATLIFHGRTGNYVLLDKGDFIPLKIKTLNKIMRRMGQFGQCRPKNRIKLRTKKLKSY